MRHETCPFRERTYTAASPAGNQRPVRYENPKQSRRTPARSRRAGANGSEGRRRVRRKRQNESGDGSSARIEIRFRLTERRQEYRTGFLGRPENRLPSLRHRQQARDQMHRASRGSRHSGRGMSPLGLEPLREVGVDHHPVDDIVERLSQAQVADRESEPGS